MINTILHTKTTAPGMWEILNTFTREDLRIVAKSYGIPRGRSKSDTLLNLVTRPCKIKLCVSVEEEK